MLDNYFLKAKPIYPNSLIEEMNISLFFVNDVEVTSVAKLVIAANNLYRIFDNGKLLGYGPARAAHDYYRVDSYELNKGKHHIVIEHVYYHCNNYCSTNTKPFLQCEIVEDKNVLAFTSNPNDFKCFLNSTRYQRVTRLSYQRAFSESYHFASNLMDFYKGISNIFKLLKTDIVENKNLLKRNVDYPKLEVLTFKPIEEGTFVYDNSLKAYDDRYMHKENLMIFPKNTWEVDPNEFISKLKYKEEKLKVLTGGTFKTYRLPFSKTGFISFDITVKEDSEFYFIFDELDWSYGKSKPIDIIFYRNTTHNIVSYECKKGNYQHITIEPYTMQFMRLVVKKGNVSINNISFIPYENPLIDGIKYEFENTKIKSVIDAAVATFAQNAVDILTDCPSRERAGWLCDSYFTGKSETLITGKNLVEHNFLENYALIDQYKTLPKGMIPMCYPGDHPDGVFIPNWSLWYILELKNYLDRTHDNKLVEMSKNKILGLLEYFSHFENELGLLENLENWVFVEWSKANDDDFIKGVNFPSNMLYARALEDASTLLGDNSLLFKAKKLKEIIEQYSFNGEFYIDNMIRDGNKEFIKTNHITETCQYYAFYFHIATKENHKELFERMVTKFGPQRDYEKTYSNVYKSNVFIGDYLRLMILLEYGLTNEVYKETVDYFYNMAKITGTLWEHDSPSASLNHGLTSSILNIICGACFGLIRIDLQEKIVYMNENHIKENCMISIAGIEIKNAKGTITIKVPEEFKIKYLDKNIL